VPHGEATRPTVEQIARERTRRHGAANGSLLVDDAVRSAAVSFIQQADDRNVNHGLLTFDDGTTLKIDRDLAELLEFVIRGLPSGSVSVQSVPAEMRSTTAASLLGVSRPTLMKMVNNGLLASHKVGAPHRFKQADVSRLAGVRRAARMDAFAKLRELDEALEEHVGLSLTT
jgi:excisionase family DNA binding protein